MGTQKSVRLRKSYVFYFEVLVNLIAKRNKIQQSHAYRVETYCVHLVAICEIYQISKYKTKHNSLLIVHPRCLLQTLSASLFCYRRYVSTVLVHIGLRLQRYAKNSIRQNYLLFLFQFM